LRRCSLGASLTLLSLHHHFSSLASALITVIGIGGAIKGAWLLLAPETGAPLTAAIVRASPLLIILALVMLVIGVWLSLVGWIGRKGTS